MSTNKLLLTLMTIISIYPYSAIAWESSDDWSAGELVRACKSAIANNDLEENTSNDRFLKTPCGTFIGGFIGGAMVGSMETLMAIKDSKVREEVNKEVSVKICFPSNPKAIDLAAAFLKWADKDLKNENAPGAFMLYESWKYEFPCKSSTK